MSRIHTKTLCRPILVSLYKTKMFESANYMNKGNDFIGLGTLGFTL